MGRTWTFVPSFSSSVRSANPAVATVRNLTFRGNEAEPGRRRRRRGGLGERGLQRLVVGLQLPRRQLPQRLHVLLRGFAARTRARLEPSVRPAPDAGAARRNRLA